MREESEISYRCPTCGEENETFVDPTAGPEQEYTEDCAMCCRPNLIHVSIAPDGRIILHVEFEG